MTLSEFFDALDRAFDHIENEVPIAPGAFHDKRQREATAFRGHLNMLKLQLKARPEKRTLSIIRSSWSTVKKTGLKHDLFSKIATDQDLKESLAVFLTDPMSFEQQ